MPSRHGCRSNLRGLIGLFQILLLLLIFGAAIILWRIRPTIDSGNLLTNVDVPHRNDRAPTSTQRDLGPNQTISLPIARYISKICRRHYRRRPTSDEKNIEFGVTLCECSSVAGHEASCTTRRTCLSPSRPSSAATPPNEASYDSTEPEEFMGKLMHLGKLVGVPCYVEAFVIPIGDDYVMPYSSQRDIDERQELCKNMAARLRIKDDETLTVGPCFTNEKTGQIIVCFTLTKTHERPHNMCFYFRVTASVVNPSTDACGGRNVTNTIAGLVSVVKSPRRRPSVVNQTIRNATSLKYRTSENSSQKGYDIKRASRRRRDVNNDTRRRRDVNNDSRRQRDVNNDSRRRRRDVNNDTLFDDPLAHMLADTLKSMVVEQSKELQVQQQSVSTSENIAPTDTAPIVDHQLQQITTPQHDNLSWIAYKKLYKVNQAMWVSGTVMLVIFLIYIVCITGVWLVRDRSPFIPYRQDSVASVRRNLLALD